MRYAELLPTALATTPIYAALDSALTPALEALEDAVTDALHTHFPALAPTDGLARWERLLGLAPLDEGLAGRRFRILARLATPAATIPGLHRWLSGLVGADGFVLSHSAQAFTLTVHIALPHQALFKDIAGQVRALCPANLALTIGMLYVAHLALLPHPHLELAPRTHKDLRVAGA